MLTQKLRHRIDIQEKVVEQSSVDGSVVETWETIRDVDEPLTPAAIEALSGREFIAAQSVQAGITTRITIRHRPGVDESMRVVHEGDFYNIKAVLPDFTERLYITLMCERGVNVG